MVFFCMVPYERRPNRLFTGLFVQKTYCHVGRFITGSFNIQDVSLWDVLLWWRFVLVRYVTASNERSVFCFLQLVFTTMKSTKLDSREVYGWYQLESGTHQSPPVTTQQTLVRISAWMGEYLLVWLEEMFPRPKFIFWLLFLVQNLQYHAAFYGYFIHNE